MQLKRFGDLLLFFFLYLAVVAACSQSEPAVLVPLPPTVTFVPLPQDTPAGRPDPSQVLTPTPTPTVTATVTLTPTLTTYIVQPGDTLFIIGNRFDVTVEEIAEANDLVNPNDIDAGQTLVIPQDQITPSATQLVGIVLTPTNTPLPTPTPISAGGNGGDSLPETGGGGPGTIQPTGRLELTHPLAMVVEDSGVITLEIIADPALATIGEHEPHATGVVRIDASYDDGERAYYEQTIDLFPLMAAELNAPAFEVFPSGGNNVRLPRVISTTLPAVWTWDVIATTPGEAQVITVNLYKESAVEAGIPILTQSISRNIQVSAKSRWGKIVDGLADNVLVLLGTGGPLGLLLGYLTYRASRENVRLKRKLAERQTGSNSQETRTGNS